MSSLHRDRSISSLMSSTILSSARRASAGLSIPSVAIDWATTSTAVCSPVVATNSSLVERPRVMGT